MEVLTYRALVGQSPSAGVQQKVKPKSKSENISEGSKAGRVEAGSGIGRDDIMAFVPKGLYREDDVGEALAVMKSSGMLAKIT